MGFRIGDPLGSFACVGTGDLLGLLGSVAERGTNVPVRGLVKAVADIGVARIFGLSSSLGRVDERALAGHFGGLSGTSGAVVISCGSSSPCAAACAVSSCKYSCNFLRTNFFSSFFLDGSLILIGIFRFFFPACLSLEKKEKSHSISQSHN